MTDAYPLIASLDDLLTEARRLGSPPLAAVVATDRHVLDAALLASHQGLINPVFIGRRAEIDTLCSALGCAFEMLDAETSHDAAALWVELVKQGRVGMLIKGHVHTAEFLHPILRELRSAPRISHVFVAQLASYHKLLFITDAAINIAPDLADKVGILNNAIDLARALGIANPTVAGRSAIEDVNTAVVSSVEAACLAKMGDRGQIQHATVDGPLALDNAISRAAVEIKGIVSLVAGDADILLVPDLVSGNVLYKSMEYFAGARFAGIVLGVTVPVVLTSRADAPEVQLASIALARVAQHRMPQGQAGL